MTRISIIGAGTYGTALAERLSWNEENRVVLNSIEDDVVTSINLLHMNNRYFPGRRLSTSIHACGTFDNLRKSNVILIAVPSFAVESVVEKCRPYIINDSLVVNLAKGLALDGKTLSEHMHFNRFGSLKGPTFAGELLNGVPSALTFASKNNDDVLLIRNTFKTTNIHIDYTEDVRGVEYLSVLKNIYAIAIGIVAGRYGSPNVDFILITKALNEMQSFLVLMQCDPKTVFKYCGIGDLGLTALNDLSRNRTLGLLIGKGFLNTTADNSIVIEGLRSVKLLGGVLKDRQASDCEFPVMYSLNSYLDGRIGLNEYCSAILEC